LYLIIVFSICRYSRKAANTPTRAVVSVSNGLRIQANASASADIAAVLSLYEQFSDLIISASSHVVEYAKQVKWFRVIMTGIKKECTEAKAGCKLDY
jgi:hypothetical protein